ncbi:MAG: hypothetical protein ACE37E_01185 [Hyphomicrobiales bacterium]
MDAAAETDDEDREDEAEAPESTEVDNDDQADAPDAEEPETAEAADGGDASDAADPETAPKQYVESDALTRLRDGSEVTIGELKKRADGEAIREREAQIEAERQRVSQQSDYFQRAIDQAMGVIEARLTPPPDARLLQDDPIGYMMQKEQRERELADLQNLQQQKQQHEAQREQETRAAAKEEYDRQIARAKEVIPELGNPETARSIVEKISRAPEVYPDMPKDAPQRISTSWEMEILRDALAYRDLQAAKTKVQEKVKDVPPVQPAGRRVSGNERRDQSLKEDLAKLKRTGDRSLGEDILSRFS